MKIEEAPPQFAICIDNAGYPASLELRKIYQVLPDEKAAKHNLVRVIDESGEDYLYPQRFFVPNRVTARRRRSLPTRGIMRSLRRRSRDQERRGEAAGDAGTLGIVRGRKGS